MGRAPFVLVALVLIGCVHVPSEVEATFAPVGPGESSNFHKGTHAVPAPNPTVAAPAPAPVPAPAPKGGEA